MTIYQDIILDHYRNPRNYGSLRKPSATTSASYPLCGDNLTLEIIEQGGQVTDIAYSGQGCAISQASASMLTEHAKGRSKEELLKLNKDFMIGLLGIQLSPNRIKCALLALETLHKVLLIQK